MSKLAVSLTVLTSCLSLLTLPALAERELADSAFVDEPRAHALYREMLATIRSAETMSYECEHEWEAQGMTLGHCTYKIWMKKPNYVRMEAVSLLGGARGVLVGDGENFWIYWPTGMPFFPGMDTTAYIKNRLTSYIKKATPLGMHSIAHDVGELGVGMSMTILEPSVFHGYDDPMQPYLDGVRSVGTDTVGTEVCDVVEASFMDNQRSRYIWLCRGDRLPRKVEEIVRVENTIFTRESWSNVATNQEMSLEKFRWTPPEDWLRYRRPALEEGLLKAGSEAPDFEALSARGTKLRLSDYRGNVVWLVFWRVGCQGCRETLPIFQRLHTKYEDRGFTVIGFNFADTKKIATDFLKELNVSFPNVLDSSPEAQNVFFRKYQKIKGRTAVPLTYVISRDGKIMDAWYGFDDDEGPAREKIEKALQN